MGHGPIGKRGGGGERRGVVRALLAAGFVLEVFAGMVFANLVGYINR